MAAAAIFRSQDCLRHINLSQYRNPNPNPCRLRRRKRSPGGIESTSIRGRRRDQTAVDPMFRAKNLVMGQVKILKRGEPLTESEKTTPMIKLEPESDDLFLCSTDRLGPDPETVQKQVRVSDGLCGDSTAFVESPPPSSLPLPAFFSKGKRNDAATSDLRRLLRLDLV